MAGRGSGSFQLTSSVPRPVYPAKERGAQCDACPLSGRKPVGPSPAAGNPRLVIVGEAPGKDEDKLGQPFIGAPGRFLVKALRRLGVEKADCHLTKAVLCRVKEQMSPSDWRQAITCCAPRLEAEIKDAKMVLAFGGHALAALTGHTSVFDWGGAPLKAHNTSVLHNTTVIGTFHPAFVLRPEGRKYVPVMAQHMERALQIADGVLGAWEWPELVTEPGPTMVEALRRIQASGDAVGLDVETAKDDRTQLYCIGLATKDLAVSVPFPFPDPETGALVTEILAGPQAKVYQNRQFDRGVLQGKGFKLGGEQEDTILLHALIAPGLRHGLGFIANAEFHVDAWKSEHGAASDEKGLAKFRDDTETRTYNAKDCVVQRLLFDALYTRARDHVHNGVALYEDYKRLDAICEEMGGNGMLLRPLAVERWRKVLGGRLSKSEAKLRAVFTKLGRPDLNPGSPKQLSELFFGQLRVPPTRWTEKGKPALNEEALNDIIAGDNVIATLLARELQTYRENGKLLSTYIDGLKPDPDGRVRFWWRCWNVVTRRFSSKPNAQNIPKKLRNIFRAGPGNVIIEADYSQLELRIIALQAGAQKLIDWYAAGIDVHTQNAANIFGGKPTKEQRQLAKSFAYAANYGASARTIWRRLVLAFPGVTLRMVEFLLDQWFKTHPEIASWQARLLEKANRDLYVEEPLSGWRQYYYGEVKPTQLYNWPIQAMAATLANRALVTVHAQINSSEKLLAQVHDSIVVEGPDAQRLAAILRGAMVQTVTIAGRTATFPIDVHWGNTWGACK